MNWIKSWPTWVKWTVGVVIVLIVVGAIAGGSEDDDGSSASSDSSNPAKESNGGSSADSGKAKEVADDEGEGSKESTVPEEDDGCGNEATDDCTPHVGSKGSVKVDGLVWKLQSAEAASSIGDPELLGEEANGVYVIVHLKVTSTKDETVTITSDVMRLVAEGDGNSYETDSDGTFAAIGDGEDPLFFEDIGPNVSIESVAVFDVPKSLFKAKTLELEFGELGFGSTTGYIALPRLAP